MLVVSHSNDSWVVHVMISNNINTNSWFSFSLLFFSSAAAPAAITYKTWSIVLKLFIYLFIVFEIELENFHFHFIYFEMKIFILLFNVIYITLCNCELIRWWLYVLECCVAGRNYWWPYKIMFYCDWKPLVYIVARTNF